MSTYLDDLIDAVMLLVRTGQLEAGTTFVGDVPLDAAAKEVGVNVLSSVYRKLR